MVKAVQFSGYGDPEVLHIVQIDKPILKQAQLLVQVKATAINPFDAKLRQGNMQETLPLNLPFTIGADFAGIVSEVPADIDDYIVGDEVFGSATVLNGGSGAMAEYAAVNVKSIAHKPNVGYEQATAAVLVGVSAIQALDQLNLHQGSKILIHGGAGGIGSNAIQYGKSLGAYIATTARPEDQDFVKQLGADEVIDYEQQRFEDVLHDYDAVFDTVGGETYNRSFQVLKRGGIVISMVEKPSQALMSEYGVTALPMASNVSTATLTRLAEVVNNGTIKPQVDRVFALEEAAQAFTHLESGHPRGKVVVKIS